MIQVFKLISGTNLFGKLLNEEIALESQRTKLYFWRIYKNPKVDLLNVGGSKRSLQLL